MKILRVLSNSQGDPTAVDIRIELGSEIKMDVKELEKIHEFDYGLLRGEIDGINERLNQFESSLSNHVENAPHISPYHDHYTP